MNEAGGTSVSLGELFRIFLMAGLTFGGGLAIVAVLERELVKKRQAIAREEFLAAVGYMVFGLPGAFAALLAVASPSFSALALLHGYQRLKTNRIAQSFFKGLTTTALGLIFYSVLTLGREAITSLQALLVFAVGFVLIQFLKLNPILGLFLAAAFGLVLRIFWS